jgi:hypothetical protein
VETRREKTGFGWEERKKGAESAMRRETIEHMWNGCSEMRERERERERKNGVMLSEDGREMGWMKDISRRVIDCKMV